MGDWRLPLELTPVLGRSDYGKSTFALRMLYNTPAACRFIFDDQGRDARRLEGWNMGIKPCFWPEELEASLSTRWSVFNPSRMFPDDPGYKKAFTYWNEWIYKKACSGPGKKLVLVNEIWQYQDRGEMPPALARNVQAGREEGIHLVPVTQLPHEMNAAILGMATEIVTFRVGETDRPDMLHLDPALRKIAALGFDPAAVNRLDKGQFIARNRLSGGMKSGRLF